MSYEYQTEYTLSPLSSTAVQVGTASPINTNAVSYVSYVAALPPTDSIVAYSCMNTLSPVNSNLVQTGVAVVSPLVNTSYSCLATNSPVNSNIIYSIGATSTPYGGSVQSDSIVLPNNHSPFEDRLETRRSRFKIDNTGSNQSSSYNSSLLTSNGSSNNSAERYSLVNYNNSPTTRPCGRDNKVGWYDIHEKHVKLATHMPAVVALTGDSIVAGLTRYSRVWNEFFKPLNALNLGIGGDRTQHVLYRMEHIVLPGTVKFVVVHCGTNNIDRDSPHDIANGIVSCGLVLQEHRPYLRVVITGLLPRDLGDSMRRTKIILTNEILKKHCRKFSNFTFMKQDSDWVLEGGMLNEQFYYSDHLHLVESGNRKFASSIAAVIDKLLRGEEVVYSEDERADGVEFERKHGESRHDTPKTDSIIYDSPYKLVKKSSEGVRQKRKRSSSPGEYRSKSEKRKKSENSSKEYVVVDVNETPKKHPTPTSKVKRKWSSIIKDDAKKEYHGEFSLTKVLKHDTSTNKVEDEHLEGPAKSIDISLSDRDRLEARKAKFSDNPVGTSLKKISDLSKASVRGKSSHTSAPSALVLKIKRSMEQAREELSKKKLAVSLQGYDSHGDSSQGESTPPLRKNVKKLLSGYGSGSESE